MYMNKTIIFGILTVILLVVGYVVFTSEETGSEDSVAQMAPGAYAVRPIEHASFILDFGGVTVVNDPVGEASAYQLNGAVPELILVSDIHGDHLSVETLTALAGEGTVIIAPQDVFDELTPALQEKTVVMANGDSHSVADIAIEAIPMYNLPSTPDAYHVKGRGNGYVLEKEDTRIYIAGDTGDTPEMRALTDIDVAFVPMNLPYTMAIDVAADAVIAFAPKVVYPYHYRGTDGLANITDFKELVAAGNPDIEVIELAWYSQ